MCSKNAHESYQLFALQIENIEIDENDPFRSTALFAMNSNISDRFVSLLFKILIGFCNYAKILHTMFCRMY